MTIEEAKKLNSGDYVTFDGRKYKVVNIKERRAALSNEIYIEIKCQRGTNVMWTSNKWVDTCS